MHINKNNILTNIRGIDMIMNLDNGAVVGLDKNGMEFYEKLTRGILADSDLKNQELKQL